MEDLIGDYLRSYQNATRCGNLRYVANQRRVNDDMNRALRRTGTPEDGPSGHPDCDRR